ncbi:heme-binding protein [Methanothermobacter thermautotrophicus]|uniref:Heme-binding protein n=1 Tax=Methanothermobacter thermautotrophicus TaxID=145262 RepID=A0A842YKI1_METTF|nr:heme-binding protein [Methanothermobacter thermautotrophicus]MBE2899318.1 heme-binding protein [Methanothermobacter thermautotrophicus]
MTESPEYTVELKDGKFEIRRYHGYILAQVDVEASFRDAMIIGFSILANYIFGGNRRKEEIPMTSPVTGVNLDSSERIPMTVPVTEEVPDDAEPGKYRISFTMPSSYTLETLPEPLDDRIKFREENDQRFAAYSFSGRVNSEMATERIAELKEWLERNSIESKSNFIIAQYNHPAVPGFLRKNEILVKID